MLTDLAHQVCSALVPFQRQCVQLVGVLVVLAREVHPSSDVQGAKSADMRPTSLTVASEIFLKYSDALSSDVLGDGQ